jgi:TolB-like protein/Flp pilus assembly protein TadD
MRRNPQLLTVPVVDATIRRVASVFTLSPGGSMGLSPGTRLGPYEIQSAIGAGGMGEVYRARDTRLDRSVAIKVLRAEVSGDPERRSRFEREAKTVASLNHPHIVTLYSVEEDAGVPFLTMELVEGQDLDQVLTPDGLPLTKVLGIGIAIADALAAAHEKGIVHRDLKPANVMLTRDGRVKVLDFGLAKLAEKFAWDQAVTEIAPITIEGAVMGTVPYMSPEQLRGQHVDHRSDIFSLGVLLYEMATGGKPFSGATNTDVMSAILRDAPRPLTEVNPGLPHQLDRIVAQCLEKEPGERYQSVRDIRDELRGLRREVESGVSEIGEPGSIVSPASAVATARIGGRRKGLWIGIVAAAVLAAAALFIFIGRTDDGLRRAVAGQPTGNEHSIAVLPFVNMSADPAQEYFSDGISEELLNLLAQITDLRVTARTSSFSFKGQEVDIPQIAKRLNVAYVLEGSVRKAGRQVRITAQLIHGADGFHVWSATYDRRLDDIFAIQDEIAADVVKQLRITLLGNTPTTRKTDPEAYALYLQSVQVARQGTRDGFEKADALLHRVLAIDSTYAPAWAGLAANCGNRAVSGLMPPEEGFARSREANTRALEIDPHYAPAYAGLAFIAMYGESDFAAAAKYLEHAFGMDPANARVLGNSATLLNLLGRKNEALTLWEAITARDPVNVNALFNLGTSQINAGRLDRAIASYRTVLSLSPGNGVAHYQMGVAMLLRGDANGALAEFDQESVEVFRMIGLPMAYHALGRKADSDAALAGLIAKYEKDATYNIAGIHAFRNEADRAFEWLEKERRNGGTFAEIVVDPLFGNLYDDPRWVPFLRKVGKAPEQLARISFKVTAARAGSLESRADHDPARVRR